MKELFSFFHGAFSLFKSISKQMYKRCAMITTGTVLVAVVAIGTHGFGGNGKNATVNAFAHVYSDDNSVEEVSDDDEILVNDMSEDCEISSQCRLFGLDIMNFIASSDNNIRTLSGSAVVAESETDEISEEADSDVNENTEVPTLVMLDEVSISQVPVIAYTEEDYNNLARIIEAEATDLDIYAKILVGNVVINRAKSWGFPNTITEVVFQDEGMQFQPIRDGRFYDVNVTASSYEAATRAIYGEDYSEGALFFATVASSGEGSFFATKLKRLFEYNGHVFFGYY